MTVQMVSVGDARAREPELYDFSSPMKLGREQLGELMKGSESFARSWQTELSLKLRTECAVAVIGVSSTSYDDYIGRLPADVAMVLCTIGSLPAKAVMQLPLRQALGWASRMLGGSGNREIAERPFTPIEQAVFTRVIANSLDLMRYAFGSTFPSVVTVDSMQYSPQAAKAAAPTDSMLVTTYEITVDGAVSVVTFAIPDDAITAVAAEATGENHGNSAERMLAQIEDAPVRVSLQFAPTRVNPAAVLGLVEGDLIRISHSKNRPLNFAVEGQVMAKAAVGASGSQLACVIVDTQETQ